MMDTFNQLLAGFATAGTPINLLWAFAGCALGTAIGVLPGLGPAVTVAMLLPITGQVEPTASMIFFAGIYYGAMYGGSTTSILLNTPGETGTMVTALEGFKMAKSGRAGAALASAAIGSFIAGTIATILVTLFAPILAEFAVKLGPPEYFCLMLLAFTTVSAVLGQSTLRGLTALFFGLALGLIGIDQITAQVRYTGGVLEFMDGIEVVLVAVGLFAVAEALYNALYEGRSEASMNKMNKVHMTRSEWRRSWPAWLRGTAIGFPFGTIPAGGTEIPTFLSYATERKLAWVRDAAGDRWPVALHHLVGDAAPQHRPALVHETGEESMCLVVGDAFLVVDAAVQREVDAEGQEAHGVPAVRTSLRPPVRSRRRSCVCRRRAWAGCRVWTGPCAGLPSSSSCRRRAWPCPAIRPTKRPLFPRPWPGLRGGNR